jgi:hypothetical protein
MDVALKPSAPLSPAFGISIPLAFSRPGLGITVTVQLHAYRGGLPAMNDASRITVQGAGQATNVAKLNL